MNNAQTGEGKQVILYCYIDGQDARDWEPYFKESCNEIDFRPWPNWGDINEQAEAYAFVYNPPHGLLKTYPNIKAIFSVWAGIDHLTSDPDLPKDIPIIRMADDSLKDGMADYAAMAAYWYMRDMTAHQNNQQSERWRPILPKMPQDYTVGIMGYGTLGKSVADRLKLNAFKLNTWSSSLKAPEDGITHYCGTSELENFLKSSNMLFCLLPNTPETTDLLNKDTLESLPKGAAVVNAGRGNLINMPDLIEHLNGGHLSGAMIDVFKEEPLKAGDPIWSAPNLIVTPHVAAITRPETSASFVIQSIYKLQNGEKLDTEVNWGKGY